VRFLWFFGDFENPTKDDFVGWPQVTRCDLSRELMRKPLAALKHGRTPLREKKGFKWFELV